jgi:hypothetical protein
MRRLVFALAFVVSFAAPRSVDAAEVCDEQGVCVDGAAWTSGDQLDDKARAKERKKHAKRKDASLTVRVNQGRGSVFVDGVWIAVAPVNFLPIKPGKHDIEVRDGETLLARGIIDIPKTGGDVTFTVTGE